MSVPDVFRMCTLAPCLIKYFTMSIWPLCVKRKLNEKEKKEQKILGRIKIETRLLVIHYV